MEINDFKLLEALVSLVSVGDRITLIRSVALPMEKIVTVNEIDKDIIKFGDVYRVNYYKIGKSGGWDLLNRKLVYYD